MVKSYRVWPESIYQGQIHSPILVSQRTTHRRRVVLTNSTAKDFSLKHFPSLFLFSLLIFSFLTPSSLAPPFSLLRHFQFFLPHLISRSSLSLSLSNFSSTLPSFLRSLPPSLLPSPCSHPQRRSELHTEARGRQQGFPFHPTVLLLYFCPDSCSLWCLFQSQSSVDLTILPTHGLHPPSLTQWVLNSCHMTERRNQITHFRPPFVIRGDMWCVKDVAEAFNDCSLLWCDLSGSVTTSLLNYM